MNDDFYFNTINKGVSFDGKPTTSLKLPNKFIWRF